MSKKKPLRYNPPKPKIFPLADEGTADKTDVKINMFDPANPDTGLFNVVDGELITVAGSELLVFRYSVDQNFDDLYDEHRGKVLYRAPVSVFGHYDPRPIEENLAEFGIELTNDQIFTFNKSTIERRLGRAMTAGDVIKPRFQNTYYEVYEVQEDSFEAYGVYHLVCSAKILRDVEDLLGNQFADPNQVEPDE
jgi:hypothetical protein